MSSERRGSSSSRAGGATVALVEGVAFLDPAASVFAAMVDGWAAQMVSRGLKRETIESRLWLLRRFEAFTNEYPWQWTPSALEDFAANLRSGGSPVALSTLRGYEAHLAMFCDYVCDARYGWVTVCEERFGSHPIQVCTEQNRVRHSSG
jgi:integrase/recombinase XerC